MLGIDQTPIQRIMFHLLDDPLHHRHGLRGESAAGRFRGEHDGVGAIVDRGRHVRCLGARGYGRGDHRFKHLRGDDHRLAVTAARPEDALLHAGHALGRQFDAQVAARDHHGVGRLHDLIEPIERGRFLQLDHQPGAIADQFTRIDQILRTLHERQRDPVGAERQREFQIDPVLLGQHGNRQDRVGNIHPFSIR